MPLQEATLFTRQVERTHDIEFLSLMVHDLRQPLSVVLGMAISLEDKWEMLGNDEKRKYVGIISDSARWMKTIVDDVLVAGEAAVGVVQSNPKSFSLLEMVEETISCMSPANQHRLSLSASHDLPLAFGDVTKQRQVLQNLLDNAIKYSGESTPIHVGISVQKNMFSVAISDRGLGISPDNVSTLFDKYVRVTDDEHTKNIEGTGLGLYVCQAVVNAQGGEIDVSDNTHGVGSVFTYTLPIAASPA